MTLINTPPPELVLRFRLMEGGGVSIINDGGGRLGSAARSTSSTSKMRFDKIGIFRAEKIHYCHPFIIAIWT